MKKISILFIFVLIAKMMLLPAQEVVTVRFTGTTEFGWYCPFDEVIVTNETRGWTDTLIYPDSVLTLSGSVGMGEYKTGTFYLSDAYPNPFNDEAYVFLEIPDASEVLLRVICVDGSETLTYRLHLLAGTHRITVTLSKPQLAFLSVTTTYGQLTAKLVYTGNGGEDALTVDCVSQKTKNFTRRTRNDAMGEFEPGDTMRYEAILFDENMTHHSSLVRRAQYVDQTVTLSFALNKSTVITHEVSEITHTTATCRGQVTYDGGLTVTERGVCWGTSYNPTINNNHTTDGMGIGDFTSNLTGLTAGTVYYVRAYSVNRIGTSYGSSLSFFTEVEHDCVDLGLPSGLLWATCNVGANNPEDYGSYFAWGETHLKSAYQWITYLYCNGNAGALTKYCNDPNCGYNGFTDDLTVLLPEDDAASVNWGIDWRMPTEDEWQELIDHTTCIWTTQNGVKGQLFIAPNGNRIFLPAAGFRIETSVCWTGYSGNYWSSSLCTNIPYDAMRLDLYSGGDCYVSNGNRYYGCSVRPVRSAVKN